MKNLNLKLVYDSIVDDVYNDFFNSVLTTTKEYMRLGGIFTSENLAMCADGMQNFIMNDGKMKLVLIPSFSKKDIIAISEGLSTESNAMYNNWINDFNQIKDKFKKNHVKALAWLLKNNTLEIKIMIIRDKNNKIIDHDQIIKNKLLDKKLGIFIGNNDDIVSFQGEITTDVKMGEQYHIDVFRYWDNSEKKRIDEHYNEFQKYWHNEKIENMYGYSIEILPLPLAIKNNLIQIAPNNKNEIHLDTIRLRPYQKLAGQKWFENNGKGIFEMATGTGKTITALNILYELKNKHKNFIIVITCPGKILVEQWKNVLKKFDNDGMIIAPDDKSWLKNMRQIIFLNNKNIGGITIIITTYKTFSNPKFVNQISNSTGTMMLIADEVHNAGAFETKFGLMAQYTLRLGLTATLERYFDPIGTSTLMDYFDKTVFQYDLKDAIDDKILVGYNYYPIYVDLTEEEYFNYGAESKIIAMYYNSKKAEHIKLFDAAIRRRSNIIKNAENKIDKFKELVKNNPNLKHTIIYCTNKQINIIPKMLLNADSPIRSKRITHETPPLERKLTLDQLADEKYEAVVSMQVLDEGVDIPQAKNCILLSSTGNPKQFIQRRGRVLRKFFGKYKDGTDKTAATIFDFLILPRLRNNMSEKERKIEKSILRSQIRRHYEMAHISINAENCLSEIEKMADQLGIEDYSI